MIDFEELYKEQQEQEKEKEKLNQKAIMELDKISLQADFKEVKEKIEKLKKMFGDEKIFKLGTISKDVFIYTFEVQDVSKYPTLDLLEIADKINGFILSCQNVGSGLLNFNQNSDLTKIAKQYYKEYQDMLFGIFQKYVYFSSIHKDYIDDPCGEQTKVIMEFVDKLKPLDKANKRK